MGIPAGSGGGSFDVDDILETEEENEEEEEKEVPQVSDVEKEPIEEGSPEGEEQLAEENAELAELNTKAENKARRGYSGPWSAGPVRGRGGVGASLGQIVGGLIGFIISFFLSWAFWLNTNTFSLLKPISFPQQITTLLWILVSNSSASWVLGIVCAVIAFLCLQRWRASGKDITPMQMFVLGLLIAPILVALGTLHYAWLLPSQFPGSLSTLPT